MVIQGPPESGTQRWDRIAGELRGLRRGEWLFVDDYPGEIGGRGDAIRAALERRGLQVRVASRTGNGSEQRPWTGVRVWESRV